MRALVIAVVVVSCFACGGDDEAPPAGATERDVCSAVATCVLGSVDPDAQGLEDACVTDEVFAEGSPACLACLTDLSCANLEAAFDGDADAQAMCPQCE